MAHSAIAEIGTAEGTTIIWLTDLWEACGGSAHKEMLTREQAPPDEQGRPVQSRLRLARCALRVFKRAEMTRLNFYPGPQVA